jgi:hypothetical protein
MPDQAPLYPVLRDHLEVLSDDMGIMQHALGARPDPAHGYCTDDVARAVLVDLLHAPELGWSAVAPSVARGMRFLQAAFDASSGRFRNLRRADGAWLPAPGSEDAHARAVRALGEMIAMVPDASLAAAAVGLFERALPAALELRWPRPQAAALLGCEAALRGGLAGATVTTHRGLAANLWHAVGEGGGDDSWGWPETTVTYENGLFPEALLLAGRRLDDAVMVARGRRLLDWLSAIETSPDGCLTVIGSAGWWPRGGARATYDQQPIEATALLLAAQAGWAVTGEARDKATMERCYGWFLGANDGHVALAIPERGACYDGLTPTGVNSNQGAESTLMWLIALEGIRRVRVGRAMDSRAVELVGRSS